MQELRHQLMLPHWGMPPLLPPPPSHCTWTRFDEPVSGTASPRVITASGFATEGCLAGLNKSQIPRKRGDREDLLERLVNEELDVRRSVAFDLALDNMLSVRKKLDEGKGLRV